MTSLHSVILSIASLLVLAAPLTAQHIPPAVQAAETSVDPEKIRAHVQFLADDLLEGRGPGLRGSELAAQYIATQFALYGLKPGGDNGTYLQQINMVGMNAIPAKTTMSLVPKKPEGPSIDLYSIDLKYGDDYTVSNRTLTPTVDIDAPIVFVGYGITAPEFNWNDYANIDVKGKVILCIVGDPPSTDPNFFGGDALTYYGRWTYKFEQAARMGAVGALIIHRTDLASYGWDVVKNSNTSEKTYLRDNKDPQLEAASWIQLDVANKIFAASGLVASGVAPMGCANCSILTITKNHTFLEYGKPVSLNDWTERIAHSSVTPYLQIEEGVPQSDVQVVMDAVKRSGRGIPGIYQHSVDSANAMIEVAGKRGFKAIELPVRLHAHVESTVRPFQSPNVVGILERDTSKCSKTEGVTLCPSDQAILYTAHFDHLGFVPGMSGDNIYNGAADNATGVGMLLEMARAWTSMSIKPPHSVIFAAVTAEEQGLLGSEYLGQHPPIPSGQIALDINYDMILPIGVPLEVNVNGAQRTTFFPTVEATAKRFNLAIVPDPMPSAGTYYRSDHFSLSRVGIPAFSIDTGNLYEGHDAAWGKKQMEDFTAHDYHNFSDNYHPDWNFAGNAKLVRFGMDLGWQALSAPTTIIWKPKDEFEAARKAALAYQ